jgi:tRNA threonylcarbamoyladenosine biosynthesis protein TsaE
VTTPSVVLAEETTTRSPDETFELGRLFAERLRGGEVVLLSGQLGAGKTLFVKGMAGALDYDIDEVTSPSFTLVNLYPGRLTIYHLDLYRLEEGGSAAHAVALDDILADERSIVAIEWPERLGSYRLPSPVWRIEIQGDSDQPRTIRIKREIAA